MHCNVANTCGHVASALCGVAIDLTQQRVKTCDSPLPPHTCGTSIVDGSFSVSGIGYVATIVSLRWHVRHNAGCDKCARRLCPPTGFAAPNGENDARISLKLPSYDSRLLRVRVVRKSRGCSDAGQHEMVAVATEAQKPLDIKRPPQ